MPMCPKMKQRIGPHFFTSLNCSTKQDRKPRQHSGFSFVESEFGSNLNLLHLPVKVSNVYLHYSAHSFVKGVRDDY